jgi:hypothetical protein
MFSSSAAPSSVATYAGEGIGSAQRHDQSGCWPPWPSKASVCSGALAATPPQSRPGQQVLEAVNPLLRQRDLPPRQRDVQVGEVAQLVEQHGGEQQQQHARRGVQQHRGQEAGPDQSDHQQVQQGLAHAGGLLDALTPVQDPVDEAGRHQGGCPDVGEQVQEQGARCHGRSFHVRRGGLYVTPGQDGKPGATAAP